MLSRFVYISKSCIHFSNPQTDGDTGPMLPYLRRKINILGDNKLPYKGENGATRGMYTTGDKWWYIKNDSIQNVLEVAKDLK